MISKLTNEYAESAFSRHSDFLDGILLDHFRRCSCGDPLYGSPILAGFGEV
jgi:hypothetical protein